MNDRIILVAGLLFIFGCNDPDQLNSACRFGLTCVVKDGSIITEEDPQWEARGINEGECSQGSIVCIGGVEGFEECSGFIGPENEVCDSLDNNCDGRIDEHASFIVGNSCTGVGTDIQPPADELGICSNGRIICSDNNWVCDGHSGPEPELCDGIDNDCNGITDDAPTDSPGAICVSIACLPEVPVCSDAEYICPNSQDLGEEVCDGLDNDCDGVVDNVIYENTAIYTGPPGTLNTGTCRAGEITCIDGIEVPVGMITPTPELCDYLDNDCDGLIDENEDGEPIETSTGYTGPSGTEGVGICHGSGLLCAEGSYDIVSEQLPMTEICDNQIDDDCDGVIDELDGAVAAQAFFIALDLSGSMNSTISAVEHAICAWASSGLLDSSRFAIGYFGTNGPYPGLYDILTDFTTPQLACYYISNRSDYVPSSGGTEYGGDLILYGAENLTWPIGLNRQVIVFSDEPPVMQASPYNLNGALVRDELIDSCQEHNYTITSFTNATMYYNVYWSEASVGCNGWQFELSSDEDAMTDSLNEAFTGCD